MQGQDEQRQMAEAESLLKAMSPENMAQVTVCIWYPLSGEGCQNGTLLSRVAMMFERLKIPPHSIATLIPEDEAFEDLLQTEQVPPHYGPVHGVGMYQFPDEVRGLDLAKGPPEVFLEGLSAEIEAEVKKEFPEAVLDIDIRPFSDELVEGWELARAGLAGNFPKRTGDN